MRLSFYKTCGPCHSSGVASPPTIPPPLRMDMEASILMNCLCQRNILHFQILKIKQYCGLTDARQSIYYYILFLTIP